jgi:glutathione S-transferase
MMKLFYSANSPYARRPRIAVVEAGLQDRVEDVCFDTPEERSKVLMELGPGAKVPGLLTDNGTYLCESLIIARHLDEVSGGKLYPSDPAAREFTYEVEGIASLLMDSLFSRSHENRRDPALRSTDAIEKEAARAQHCYDALNARVDRFEDQIDMGTITSVASLGYADGRHPGDDWRKGRPKLAAWFEQMMQRPSMANTKPSF